MIINDTRQHVLDLANRLLSVCSPGTEALGTGVLVGAPIGESWDEDATTVARELYLLLGNEFLEVRPPIALYLNCPSCGARHIDEGEFETKPHHTHACQECGLTWRPAIENTVGVRFLPGFKNPE